MAKGGSHEPPGLEELMGKHGYTPALLTDTPH